MQTYAFAKPPRIDQNDPMRIDRDFAIVLRSTPYQERHLIVTALTRDHGQISALAKNAIHSRRFGPGLELFTASEWILRKKPNTDLYQLTDILIKEPFEPLRKDFEKLTAASAFNEILLRVSPLEDPCLDLFKLYFNSLTALASLPEQHPVLPLMNCFLAKILQWTGHQPRLHSCLDCNHPLESIQTDLELNFLAQEAGWICPSCRRERVRTSTHRTLHEEFYLNLQVNPLGLLEFQKSLHFSIRSSSANASDQAQTTESSIALFRVLEALLIYHVPGFDQRPIQSFRFLGLESILQRIPKRPL